MTVETVETVPTSTSAAIARGHLRGSSLLLLGRFIALGLNFAVQVLIVRFLAQSDYGAFAYALSLAALAQPLVTLGLDRGVGRFLAMYDEHRDTARTIGTLILMAATVLSLGLALVLVVIGVQGLTGGVLINDAKASALLTIMIVLAPIQAADDLLSGVLAVFASARAIFFRKHILVRPPRIVVVGPFVAG